MKKRTVQILEKDLIQGWIYKCLIPDKATGIALIQDLVDKGQIKRLADGKTLEFEVPDCPEGCGGCGSDQSDNDCSEDCGENDDCCGDNCQCDDKKN